MISKDVIIQLASILPQISNDYTTSIAVTSIGNSGGLPLVTTATDHGLITGDVVNIAGADTPIAIDTLTRTGIVGSAEFATDHDYTLGRTYKPSVIIEGAVEGDFNGTFPILSVPNRKNITFQMPDTGATVATGSPIATNASNAFAGYNGISAITFVTAITFTLDNKTYSTDGVGTIVTQTAARISGALSLERAIDSYTKQNADQIWLFVVLDDVNASRSRKINSDAVDNLQRNSQGEGFRQQTIQSFSVYAFIPTSGSISGRAAMDKAQQMFSPICQSILFHSFDTFYAEGAVNAVQFTSHGFEAYNSAFYIHRYSFEQSADLTFSDTVGYDVDVAFRDIALSMTIDPGTGEDPLTADINLDEEPLP